VRNVYQPNEGRVEQDPSVAEIVGNLGVATIGRCDGNKQWKRRNATAESDEFE